MTLSINHQNDVPEHVAEELDRLGNSDEGIAMGEVVRRTSEGLPPEVMGADRSQVVEALATTVNDLTDRIQELARQLEQVEAQRDRYREALEIYADGSTWGVTRAYSDLVHVIWLGEQSSPWADARAALHPKERDDG